jgi:hemerythrin-like domain-containing protein
MITRMKTATQNLENDHVHILRLTDIMEQLTVVQDPDVTHLEKIVEIIRNFADGVHHAKEEQILFPYLAKKGFSQTQGPVAVMLNEHVSGRNFVKGMSENIELYKKGDRDALGKIYYNMAGYADLLRSHISKENNILFRMADRVLSDSEQEDLLRAFETADKSFTMPEEYISQIEYLSVFYEV